MCMFYKFKFWDDDDDGWNSFWIYLLSSDNIYNIAKW